MPRVSRRQCAVALLLAGFAAPQGAAAAVPADGVYSSRAAGVPRPAVAFTIRKARIVKPRRDVALSVSGLRCARGERRYAWTNDVTVRGGRLRGSLFSGQFDARGRWARGEAFEITGRWSRRGLADGRMRYRRTVGRRCDSGWVRWKGAPRDPVAVTSSGPLSFVVPGDVTVTGIVVNTGEATSKTTDLDLFLSFGGFDTLASRGGELVAARPSQGTCDPAFRPAEGGIGNVLTCRFGALPARRRATVDVTLRWPASSCVDPESSSLRAPFVTRQVMLDSALNDAPRLRDPKEDDVPDSTGDCSGVTPPPRPPPPVDEP